MKKLTYGGKPHICYKIVPFELSYTPLNEGTSICSECRMLVDSKTDRKHFKKIIGKE